MQVICTDGTAFTCEGYELTEFGVVLYDQPQGQETDRYDSDPKQVGYVPHDRLWYILPDGVTPNRRGEARGEFGQLREESPPPTQSGQHPVHSPQQPPRGPR